MGLLQDAMRDSGKGVFLIDGFPRNEENRAAFEEQVGQGRGGRRRGVGEGGIEIGNGSLVSVCFSHALNALSTRSLLQTKITPEFILFFDCPAEVRTVLRFESVSACGCQASQTGSTTHIHVAYTWLPAPT